MEELQDAIEDAQYLSAVSSVEDGPRPVLPWEVPTEDQLAAWKSAVSSKTLTSPHAFSFEWVLSRPLGLFLFSSYLKEAVDDYVEINFLEEVARWKATRGRLRADITGRIVENYLTAVPLSSMAEEGEAAENGKVAGDKRERPPKTEIHEYDLLIQPITKFTPEKITELRAECYDADTDKSCVGLCGSVLDKINKKVEQLRNTPGFGRKYARDSGASKSSNRNSSSSDTLQMSFEESIKSGLGIKDDDDEKEEKRKREAEQSPARRHLSLMTNALPEDLFDEAIVIIAENVKDKHWKEFQESEHYGKLLNFLWFQDRPVVEEDFFLMRVLGRGGFGLVTGMYLNAQILILYFLIVN